MEVKLYWKKYVKGFCFWWETKQTKKNYEWKKCVFKYLERKKNQSVIDEKSYYIKKWYGNRNERRHICLLGASKNVVLKINRAWIYFSNHNLNFKSLASISNNTYFYKKHFHERKFY